MKSPECNIAGAHQHHNRCCWCPRGFISDLPSVLFRGDWHPVCATCLRHVFGYPAVHRMRRILAILLHTDTPETGERLWDAATEHA